MKTGTDALGALSGTQGGSMSECEVFSGAYSGQGASPEAALHCLPRPAKPLYKCLMAIIYISKDNGHYQQA